MRCPSSPFGSESKMRFKPAKGGLALPVGAHDILNMETTIILISASCLWSCSESPAGFSLSPKNYHSYL